MRYFLALLASLSSAFVFANSQSAQLCQDWHWNYLSQLNEYADKNYTAKMQNILAENFLNTCVAKAPNKEEVFICGLELRNSLNEGPSPARFNENQIFVASGLGEFREKIIQAGCPEPTPVPPPVNLKNFNQFFERYLNK